MATSGQTASAASWHPLGPAPAPDVLAEILDGGQAFRWRPPSGADDAWQGIWSRHAIRLRSTGNALRCKPDGIAELQWSLVAGDPATAAGAVRRYLVLDQDFSALADSLPWRSDPHLARCLAAFPGLRLPRQPFGETLLGFLCSATKQIVQIKEMVALLAARHGAPLAPGLHALPTWAELAAVPEPDLRACLLGFRARYIAGTARFLAGRPGWLEETESLPYAAAKARLLELPGVGEKVADCVLLFGAGRLEAFPVDTWILKAMAAHYGLAGWSPAQVAHFGRVHFGPLAGLAQQFLFAWERRRGRASPQLGDTH